MMKLLVLILLFTINSIVHASDIEGDTNNDGILSGSEQYLLNNPSSIQADRETVTKTVRDLKAQEQEKQQRLEEHAIFIKNHPIQQTITNNQRSDSSDSSSTQTESNTQKYEQDTTTESQLDEQKRELDRREQEMRDKEQTLNQQEQRLQTPPPDRRTKAFPTN